MCRCGYRWVVMEHKYPLFRTKTIAFSQYGRLYEKIYSYQGLSIEPLDSLWTLWQTHEQDGLLLLQNHALGSALLPVWSL